MKPIKTTGRLHFDDLSHERFEDLSVQLNYTLKPWTSFQHYGRAGKDRGVDIWGEYIRDSVSQTCVIQCKRYKKISKKQLQSIVDEFVREKEIPSEYLLVLACDISRDVYEEFKRYAKSKGLLNVDVIGASVLEAELSAKRPDLLYAFFGVKTFNKRTVAVARLQQRLATKMKVIDQLLPEVGKAKKNGVSALRMINRDVHRDIYPELDESSLGISPWFKLEFHRTYHRGISFYLSVESVLIKEDGSAWKLWNGKPPIPDGCHRINAFCIGNIPFDNIVDIDVEGDEFYPYPHIYCEFNNLGSPYEKIWYKPTDEYQSIIHSLPSNEMMQDR